MNLLELAIDIASKAHSGQIDEDGLPHIVHSVAVMLQVQQSFQSQQYPNHSLEEVMIAAVLHDVVEDSKDKFTLDDIQHLFGHKVAAMVNALSRREGESYRDFIYRVKLHAPARLIKIADLTHNRSRTHQIKDDKWQKKLEYKYEIAEQVLNDTIEPTWEGASFEYIGGKYYIADPNGKRIELSKEQADNVHTSFIISN